MPYLDVYVDDDQFDKIVVDELDFAIAEDKEIDSDPELRRAFMLVRNYFSVQSELVQQSFSFMYDEGEMSHGISSQSN